MKKLLTFALACIIALSMAACSPTKNDGSTSSIGGGKPSSSDTNSKDANSGDALSTSSFFGKVSSVAGNEIELNLAKLPEMPAPEEGGIKIDEDGTMDAVAMTPAVMAGSAVAGGAEQRDELELTGETKPFVIPAGMKIKDSAGVEKQLSDIKKGSTMNIFVDAEGNVTEVLLYE